VIAQGTFSQVGSLKNSTPACIRARISTFLHCFAGLLLLFFALSHFSMLTVSDVTQHLRNVVFPFTTNWTVYLVAGIFELAVAIVCLGRCGSDTAYAAISVFLIVILWYRWALYNISGHFLKACSCLGILGKALSLSPAMERILPIIVLILLGLIVLPWLLGRLLGRLCHLLHYEARKAAGGALLILLGMYCASSSYAEETIHVRGKYDCFHCNAFTGEPDLSQSVHALFSFTMSGNTWSIYATNLVQVFPWQKPWMAVIYDGTDTYTLLPDVKWEGKLYHLVASISPGPLFLQDSLVNGLELEPVYMTYGIRPGGIAAGKQVVEIPLPWYSRLNPLSYGADWKITPSEDGQFISECKVVANTNLDLKAQDEALRPMLIYPHTLQSWNDFVSKLSERRDQFTNGFVHCEYSCKEWRQAGGVMVPFSSEELRYSNQYYPVVPRLRGITSASEVTVQTSAELVLPERVPCDTLVIDYRYRRQDKVHLLPFLTYDIPASGQWKSGTDPELTHRAVVSLKSAIRFDYTSSMAKSYMTWLVLGLALLPLFFLLKKKQKQQTNERTVVYDQ
jgi:hypothetical protein